jgi:hypothetical protein
MTELDSHGLLIDTDSFHCSLSEPMKACLWSTQSETNQQLPKEQTVTRVHTAFKGHACDTLDHKPCSLEVMTS